MRQGAFKNGMHDRVGGLRLRDPVYRKGPWPAPWNRLIWRLGWLFQAATGLGYVAPLAQVRRYRSMSDNTWN